MRDGKFTRYEGGFRVPCILRYPDKISRGTVCSKIVSTIDLLPTIADMAGADIPKDRTIDGKSIVNLLEENKCNETIHDYFYYYKEAVRSGQWKLYKPGMYVEFYENEDGNIKKHKVEYDKYRLSGEKKEHRKHQISEFKNWKMIADNRYKYIKNKDKKRNELYDLKKDPQEINNIASENEEIVKKYDKYL